MYQLNSENIQLRSSSQLCKTRALLLALAAAVVVSVTSFASVAQAQTQLVEIRWTYPSTIPVDGFRVYTSATGGSYGPTPDDEILIAEVGVANQSPFPYFAMIQAPVTSEDFYVVVTAFSATDESAFSNENVYQVQVQVLDRDGDGVPDHLDIFPDDPTESADRDGDGIGDNGDAFPDDSNEWADSDGDGVGDQSDVFPNDPNESADRDGDGYGDNGDIFPNNSNEWADSDGDGVGDQSDAFPNDPTRSTFTTTLSPYRVDVGANLDYTAPSGQTWTRDSGFWNLGHQTISASTADITGTTLDQIYRSSRSGQPDRDPMVFSFPLPDGKYQVRLHFAEETYTDVDERMFDIEIEGATVARDFDIYRSADGVIRRAVVRSFSAQLQDGELNITFRYSGGSGGPTVMGIEVVSEEAIEGEVLTSPGKPFIIEVN
jgi:hypothetical protein